MDQVAGGLRQRVERKLLVRLIIPIASIAFVNAIDRVNVSCAGSAMSADPALSPDQFGLGVSMFFFACLLFQHPHVRLLRAWPFFAWRDLALARRRACSGPFQARCGWGATGCRWGPSR